MDQQTGPTPRQPEPPPQRRLERSRSDRMLAGVCGGIAKYLGVDATLVRVVLAGLTVLGGAGVLLYVAALLLMPEEGSDSAPIASAGGRAQALTVIGVIVLAVAAFAALAAVGTVVGWILFPAAVLVVAGLFAWWLASGQRPAGSPGQILKVAALGLALLAACFAVAIGGAWAAASGSGSVAAALVIGAGVVLVAAAFVRPARWLIMPALSLGLAAAFVAATGIELDGGIGEREYRPASATDVRDRYQLGIGELVVDLRDADLPAGDHRIAVDVGIGHAVVLVAEDVCVTTEVELGIGAVDAFDSENGGIDVTHVDARSAPPGTPHVILHGDLGIGMLDVHHADLDADRFGHGRDERWDSFEPGGNDACAGGARAAVGGGGSNG